MTGCILTVAMTSKMMVYTHAFFQLIHRQKGIDFLCLIHKSGESRNKHRNYSDYNGTTDEDIDDMSEVDSQVSNYWMIRL